MAQATTHEQQQHPNPVANPHHRKIELQSLADLTYLQHNLASATRGKLDLHFPPQHSTTAQQKVAPAEVIILGGTIPQSAAEQESCNEEKLQPEPDEDPLRRNVRLLVDSFLQQTFGSASHSISVNGIDATSIALSAMPSCSNPDATRDDPSSVDPADPANEIEGIHYTYAPYDPRISKRLQILHQELEMLTSEVSKLRRTAPNQAAESYTAALQAALSADEERWELEMVRVAAETHEGLNLDQQRDGWNEDVRRVFDRGVDNLAGLSGVTQKKNARVSLMETAGKVQRAQRVAMELE